MPRKPLPVGTWGRIARTEVAPKRHVARARFRDTDGVTRKVEAWGVSGAAAERALVQALKDRAAVTGTDLTADSRLRAVSDLWLRTRIENTDRLATNTRERYRDVVERYVDPGVGGLTVREATVPALERFLTDVTGSSGPGTAKLCRTVLSGMLDLAVLHGAATANAAKSTSVIATEGRDVRALSVDEVKALRAALRGDRKAQRADLPLLVDLMLATGCRIGEALAIRWDDVDLDAGTVAITGTVVRVKGEGLTRQDTTKGKKVRRLLLPKFAVALLLERSVSQVDGGPWNVVVPSERGSLREVSTVEAQWRRFRERQPAWKWVTPHTFRKTVGTLVDRERGTGDAAAQLGHSSTTITARHYVETADVGPDLTAILQQFSD